MAIIKIIIIFFFFCKVIQLRPRCIKKEKKARNK